MDQNDKTFLWMAIITLVCLILGSIFAYAERTELASSPVENIKN